MSPISNSQELPQSKILHSLRMGVIFALVYGIAVIVFRWLCSGPTACIIASFGLGWPWSLFLQNNVASYILNALLFCAIGYGIFRSFQKRRFISWVLIIITIVLVAVYTLILTVWSGVGY